MLSERARYRGSDRQRTHSVCLKRSARRSNAVACPECSRESFHGFWGDRVWAGAPYPSQVLGLEPQSATLHLHAVSGYLPLNHLGQQKAAQDLKVPAIGDDVI